MKKLLFAAAFMFCCLSFKMASAQIHFSIGVNIGNQPEWGPVGYERADYYYMPDIDAYYDVNAHTYIYFNNDAWVRTTMLPPRYAGYDVYRGYKVVINRPDPWRYEAVYRTRYARYRGHYDQGIIRDSRDDRYRDHWHGDNGHHYGDRNHDGDNHWDHGRGHDGDHGDHGHGHGHDH
ncbi:MAG: hypothetical protein ACTHNW_07735 [Mucilaginibacter sp.]